MEKIELYYTNAIALIIESKTGVIYIQQCGGISCTHPEVEGYCIPFSGDENWEQLCKKTCEVGCRGANLVGLNVDLDKFVQGLELDKSRLDKGTEAFIPVVYEGKNGWLMLPYNCD